jgi:hypothetical protein
MTSAPARICAPVYGFDHFVNHPLCDGGNMTPAVDYLEQESGEPPCSWDFLSMEEDLEAGRVAGILDREARQAIREWLRMVELVPALMGIRLSDKDRVRHLPVLFREIIFRLRCPTEAAWRITGTATAHGHRRQAQGYSPAMLVEESRIFQVATFNTLRLHQSELDASRVLADVVVIADEADSQLGEAVRSLTFQHL